MVDFLLCRVICKHRLAYYQLIRLQGADLLHHCSDMLVGSLMLCQVYSVNI